MKYAIPVQWRLTISDTWSYITTRIVRVSQSWMYESRYPVRVCACMRACVCTNTFLCSWEHSLLSRNILRCHETCLVVISVNKYSSASSTVRFQLLPTYKASHQVLLYIRKHAMTLNKSHMYWSTGLVLQQRVKGVKCQVVQLYYIKEVLPRVRSEE